MMADLIDGDSALVRIGDVASRLGVSARTTQRLAARYVGLPPAAMIRRRRIQEASERLRNEPDADIATIAADFGYSDQAHLANDFRTVLGLTPVAYRNLASGHPPVG
jgi:AraC-like DNA-binding protein